MYNSILFFYQKIALENSDFKISIEKLHDDLFFNLEEIFQRIESHNLPYIELYDELFKWFTHARSGMNNQITICNRDYKAISPTMGMQILRKVSQIHPNLRLSNRLMDNLFKETEFSKNLFSIPTSQAPFITQNAPGMIKFLVWGLRSSIDSYFIKRIMKNKNKKLRYRVLPSLNWIKIYDDEENFMNFKQYFTYNTIGEKWFIKLENDYKNRNKLKSWPYVNTNFISAAALNKELELIEKFKLT